MPILLNSREILHIKSKFIFVNFPNNQNTHHMGNLFSFIFLTFPSFSFIFLLKRRSTGGGGLHSVKFLGQVSNGAPWEWCAITSWTSNGAPWVCCTITSLTSNGAQWVCCAITSLTSNGAPLPRCAITNLAQNFHRMHPPRGLPFQFKKLKKMMEMSKN